MTVIHMTTAALPLHEMVDGALSAREREFRGTVRGALEAADLRVIEVFAKGAAPRNLPEVLPDGSMEETSYITITVGVDVDASPDQIEHACANLFLPGFPASAWRFPEE
ncbi:MAG: hypothetical protein WAW17_02500 [Rhodococcus sp. (in: high G+C Gram-positive bacteria)]|uniref:hypothetical protein n=1 Tax=Rhodococcus sp. TaxID=1831 RepID=UPI003BB080A1